MRDLGKVFFSLIGGIIVFIAVFFLCLKFAPLPVAVADSPFPLEKQSVKIALRSRISRQMQSAPFGVNEDVLQACAHIYREQCSICHGIPGHDSGFAKHMYPAPPQLWKKHGDHGAVGVSEDEPGFSYWIVSNGIRLTGMPSFINVLSDTQRWQVSLLLKNANQEQPASVTQILNAPPLPEQSADQH